MVRPSLLVALALTACTIKDVDYTGKSCPCPDGWSCDTGTNTCARTTPFDAGGVDATDGATGDALACWGTGLVNVCPAPGWPTSIVAQSITINTDTSTLCTQALPNACVIVADRLSVPSGVTLTARGSRPLVVLGVLGISIAGKVDVGSHHAIALSGAGGDPTTCVPSTAAGALGGGAGGTFAGVGGKGGQGNGSPGGTSAAAIAVALQGGCGGEVGGGAGAGAGGHGGGVIYMISGGTIMIDGSIDASGAGGSGATAANNGGGGGGAGGLIGLDAPTLAVGSSAKLYSNGGGGGAGTGTTVPGNDGADPSGPDTAAAGGVGDPSTGVRSGGIGSVGTGLDGGAGRDSNSTGGGGGGGGAAGFVKVYPFKPIGGSVSPPPS